MNQGRGAVSAVEGIPTVPAIKGFRGISSRAPSSHGPVFHGPLTAVPSGKVRRVPKGTGGEGFEVIEAQALTVSDS